MSNARTIPIGIHFLSSSSPWAHDVNKGSRWSSCLPAICLTVDFHLATMRASKPGIVVWGTPIQMFMHTFQPVINNFTPFLFTHCSQLLINTFINVPNVTEVLCFFLFGPYPLCNSFMSVTNKDIHLKTRSLQEIEWSFCTFQFHGIATTNLICLKDNKIFHIICHQYNNRIVNVGYFPILYECGYTWSNSKWTNFDVVLLHMV